MSGIITAIQDLVGLKRSHDATLLDATLSEERPRKLQKTINRGQIASQLVEFEKEENELPLAVTGAYDTTNWKRTIEGVVRNVVSIRFCQTCAFDTDPALTSEATGFVVDAERGYILTNRHVVGTGPFWGYAIFDNHQEVDCYAVYRDPVHDFGILRFDVNTIKHIHLAALQLRPDLAKVGAEIRVVGNDAGEKLSILSGVISRLDRNAPEYGEGYNDFNTNYIQAAAAASGGSSGSPVVNIDGIAIALQAGGRSDGAATDYFLPLDRPKRALECLQNQLPITRGTIQCQWMIEPFDKCRRLGLTSNWEDAVRQRFPKETGMLVAAIILPEGPSDKKIAEGDVLIKVNGELLTQFVRLDDILDTNVGENVQILVQRGGKDVEVEVEVGDLHKITPDRFVSVAGANFHDLSYQLARFYAVACKGVFICKRATGSFRSYSSGWIVQTVNHKTTPDLTTFIKVMEAIPDRARVVVTSRHLRDLHTLNTNTIHIDRHWSSKMRLAVRNDATGLWDFTDLADPLPPVPPVLHHASFIQLENAQYPTAAEMVRSFVRISCYMPLKLDGFPLNSKGGMGVVIDAEKGLVVVSRALVPYDLCDISVTIADSIIVDGKVVFMHPLQNYAIIQYDPSLVDAPVLSAKLSKEAIRRGASIYFVGINQNMRILVTKTTVSDITSMTISASTTTPRYRAINFEGITIDTSLKYQCGSGVLLAEDGTVQALWLTYLGERSASTKKDTDYHVGIGTPTLLPIIEKIQAGIAPRLRMLGVELKAINMSYARIRGVSEEWISKVAIDNTADHQLFEVQKKMIIQGDELGVLFEGDVILSLNGKIITRLSELNDMYDHEMLDAVIVREGIEMTMKVPTVSANDLETERVVLFCGATLHKPHHAVRQQISKLHSEVYVSEQTLGSPSYQYDLHPNNFVTHVNDIPTPDLEAFVKEVIKIPDNTCNYPYAYSYIFIANSMFSDFRVKGVTFNNVNWVVTMKKNDQYFPTMEWIKESWGWRQVTYECTKEIAASNTF